MTDADKKVATELVYAKWRVRIACRRDPERVGKIADVVWKYLEDTKERRTRNNFAMPERPFLVDGAGRELELRPDYQDLVSFVIPLWFIFAIIRLVIEILIDYWFMKQEPE